MFEGNSQDPISLHKYLFAQDSPVDFIDPSGLNTIAEEDAVATEVGNLSRITIPRAVSASKRLLARAACAVARSKQVGPIHHLFTKYGNKGLTKFGQVFKKAGLDLEGWYNKIKLPGHWGPHPEYNEAVKEIHWHPTEM